MKLQKIKDRIFKTIKWLLISLLFFVFSALILVSLEPVQTYLAKKTANYLSDKTHYEITIDRLAIKWFDVVAAHELSVKDKNGNKLFDIHQLTVDYQLLKLLSRDEIELDKLTLLEPDFNVGWYEGDKLISFSEFVKVLRELLVKPKANKEKSKILPFNLVKGEIINGTFTYFDKRKVPVDLENYFDYNYFTIDSIYGDVSNFKIFLDSISLETNNLTGKHTNSHLKIHELKTKFSYCNQHMLLDDLELNVGQSLIKDSISFEYDNVMAFSHFNDSVKIVANLNQSIINSKDLQVFAPQVHVFNDIWGISTDVSGYVRDFSLKNLTLDFGKGSTLNGALSFDGLPKINEMFLDLHFEESKIIPSDLKQYIPNQTFYNKGLQKFGSTTFNGNFRGFVNNFVANADFQTQLGYVSTDVNFVLNDKDYSKSTYSGDLRTKNFNVGSFLDIDKLGKADLSVKIKPGSYGFSTNSADIKMVGEIRKITYQGYNYTNINLDANLAKNMFNGQLEINDPNLKLKGIANVNLNKGETFVAVDGKIFTLNANDLGFSKEVFRMNGNMDIQLEGFRFDPITGQIDIDDLNGHFGLDSIDLFIKNDHYSLVKFDFNSSFINNQRTLELKSNFLDASLVGDYKFKTIINDFPVLVKEYMLFFENDRLKNEEHYAEKDKTVHNYQVAFNAKLKNASGFIALIDSNIQLSNNTEIIGELKRGQSSVFNFISKPEYFRYRNYEFFDNEIDINSSKLVDSSSALASIFIKSKNQAINGQKYFQNTDLLVNVNKEVVDFVFKTNQHESDNYLYFRGNADYFKDSLLITFDKSYLHLLGKDWFINDKNRVTIMSDLVKFNAVSFNNDYQLLSINGNLSTNKEDILKIKLRDFDIRNLESLSSVELGGLINGDLEVYDAFDELELRSKILIDDFSVLGDTLGKIKGKIDWYNKSQKLSLDVDMIRDNLVVTHAAGSYDVSNTISPINIDFIASNAEIKLLEPFMSGYVKSFKGVANGKIKLTGTLEEPNWQGKLDVRDAGFLVSYFQTYYEFSNDFIFDKESIYCRNLKLTDTVWKSNIFIDGNIKHHWFKNYSANAELKLKNSYVLNTGVMDNQLYYGTAFATGNISIDGPFSNLKIWSKELTSNAGTTIYVPLEEPESLSKKDYISFVTKESKLDLNQTPTQKLSLSGVDMDINFNITKDANFEIIFDANAGDKIKGRGEGLINMKIDTRGDFNMFGVYAFEQGTYNFTLVDLVNKKFDIKKGSRITWDGDPYQGELSLDAVYQQYTSLRSLVTDSTILTSNPDVDRKVPVDIHLLLSGKLLNPEVRFAIDIKEYPSSLETLVAEITTKFQNEDQFRNKQVFSLIVLKQFSADQNIGNVAEASSKNLSELFSNQFSSWVSQFDENLNVAIDFSGYDPENNNIFRMKLEYSLLDGRLRVSRDGSFTNLESTNQLANVFGEWTIEYLITPDGKIRMKAFNKNSTISSITSNEASINTTYGFSITHNKSFDSLKELFKRNPNTTQLSN